MNATTPNTETHELTDAELNAVTGGFGGNLAAAVVKGVNTARDEYYLSQQHWHLGRGRRQIPAY